MTNRQTKTAKWAEIVCEVGEWMDIDDIHKLCRARGLWNEEDVDEQVIKWQKAEIRNLARNVRRDAMGREIELVSLERMMASGKKESFYKQLMLFDLDDFVQVIRERLGRVDYWRKEVDRFIRVAFDMFGDEAQMRLDFATEVSCATGAEPAMTC